MESSYLKALKKQIGTSVYPLNTIAVALHGLRVFEDGELKGQFYDKSKLDITWTINYGKRLKTEADAILDTKKRARAFAVRSAIVYGTEAVINYFYSINNDALWSDGNTIPSGGSAAINIKSFLDKYIGQETFYYVSGKNLRLIRNYDPILVKLLIRWRNKLVHIPDGRHRTLPEEFNQSDYDFLMGYRSDIIREVHNLDVKITLDHFHNNFGSLITLKEASSLLTSALRCAEAIDRYYIDNIGNNIADLVVKLRKDSSFSHFEGISKQSTKERSIRGYLSRKYPQLKDKIGDILRSI